MEARDEALIALQRRLAGSELAFATVLDVTDGGAAGVLIRARSGRRLHAHALVLDLDEVRRDLDELGERLDVDDPQRWAAQVATWAVRTLDSGVLRWGRRVVLPDGTMAIDPSREPGPRPAGRVSSVPLERPTRAERRRVLRSARGGGPAWPSLGGRRRRVVTLGDGRGSEPDPAPGSHLRREGFDVRPGRVAREEGRLIAWRQAFADGTLGARLLGHLVVSWRDEATLTAQLEHVELRTDAPDDVVARLLLTGLQDAADAGARWVEHAVELGHPAPDVPREVVDGRARVAASDIP